MNTVTTAKVTVQASTAQRRRTTRARAPRASRASAVVSSRSRSGCSLCVGNEQPITRTPTTSANRVSASWGRAARRWSRCTGRGYGVGGPGRIRAAAYVGLRTQRITPAAWAKGLFCR
ncbi:hypothetical protein ACFQZ4_33860 [Catellatospora coxensis]